jgi:hypothetical protein
MGGALVDRRPVAQKRAILSDLDPKQQYYVREAADRIAALEDLGDVELALAGVLPPIRRTVETLAFQFIAERIAKIQPERDTPFARQAALERRRAELAKLPGDYRARVEPHVATWYQTKPWLTARKRRRDRL